MPNNENTYNGTLIAIPTGKKNALILSNSVKNKIIPVMVVSITPSEVISLRGSTIIKMVNKLIFRMI